MATQTASAMLKEIAALETFSETTFSDQAKTITWTYVPFRVVVMATKIVICFNKLGNGKIDSILEMPLTPNARVKQSLLKSGITVRRLDIDVPPHTLAELKEHLVEAARYEKLKALIE